HQTRPMQLVSFSYSLQYFVSINTGRRLAQRRDFPALLVQTLDSITQFLHKGFIAQNCLPSDRFERTFNLPHQPLLDKTPVPQSLRAPGPTQFSQRHLLFHKGKLRAQTSVTTITAPLECAQTFPPLGWSAPPQAHSPHWIKMHIPTQPQQMIALLHQKTLVAALKQMTARMMPPV